MGTLKEWATVSTTIDKDRTILSNAVAFIEGLDAKIGDAQIKIDAFKNVTEPVEVARNVAVVKAKAVQAMAMQKEIKANLAGWLESHAGLQYKIKSSPTYLFIRQQTDPKLLGVRGMEIMDKLIADGKKLHETGLVIAERCNVQKNNIATIGKDVAGTEKLALGKDLYTVAMKVGKMPGELVGSGIGGIVKPLTIPIIGLGVGAMALFLIYFVAVTPTGSKKAIEGVASKIPIPEKK